MAARKNVVVYTVCEAQSLAADYQSPPTWIKYLDNASYQINVTPSGSTGTIEVQVSNDYAVDEITGAVLNVGAWTPLDLGGTPTVNSSADNIIIDLNQLGFKAMRLAYISSVAGTGTMSAYLTAKEI